MVVGAVTTYLNNEDMICIISGVGSSHGLLIVA